MSTPILLSPFSLSVLNVAIMLTLLIVFLWRIPNRSPATGSVLFFLLGVDVVFFAFLYIFSSLNLHAVSIAWWLLHAVIFFILFMVRFSYTYPRPHFASEHRRVTGLGIATAALVYAGYLYHTTLIQPVFAPGGYLFVFLGTPEVGIAIGLMLAWSMAVFWRTRRWLAERESDNPLAERQRSAIGKLVLLLFSPLVLVTFIVLAYQGLVSWEVVGHLLGSGVMVFLFLFTVIYLNNSVEPTTLMVKVVGLSLGAILILLGFAASLTMNLYKEAFLEQKVSEVERSVTLLARHGSEPLPADIAYVASNGTLSYTTAHVLPRFHGKPRAWEEGWLFRELQPNQPQQFYIAHQLTRDGVLYEVGYPYLLYRQHIHTMALPLAWLSLAAALFVLLVFPLFFRLSLFNPLRRLLEGVASVDAGQLDVKLPVVISDEIGRLTRAFNHMTDSVRDSRQQLRNAYDYQRELTDAYSRFVPKEILTTLNKATILELGLGDSVQKEMTILFSDIRAFTTLSEHMSPAQVFQFINRYLERVGPVVRRHGGYIDKYIGDAVMALFPNATAAVTAAVEMQQQVRSFNEECARGEVELPGIDARPLSIHIGIGIHTGELMLGTIGEQERMEGTVISDAVNLASRLEGLTKFYNAPILISDSTYTALNQQHDFSCRLLDRVRVRGKSTWVDIHEVIDGNDPPLRESKLAQRERFATAVSEFRQGHFTQAERLFVALSETASHDHALELYRERCHRFVQEPPPADWEGAVTL